ncbi:collagen alpha-6(VI) chain-like [Podarcis raffonei]|uniref:collagen alpha-6(VI) chain-like n=1 Tax=Podarcis raffonei TaxID=65483 RepID=UPI002329781B|nr:collagen alpha-6(VI) chain-like [Podarcis raffonei]
MDNWNQRFILVFLTLLCSTDAQTTVCRETAIADLVFLVDGSWSIGTKNFKSMQDFLYTMVDGLDIGPDKIQVGLIQYSDLPHNEFFLNTFHRKEDILNRIQNLHYKGGGTKTGKSLKFMLDHQFNEVAGSRRREGVPQVAVVITDGEAQDDIREPSKLVKSAGITLYALGIKDAVLSELQLIASDPDETHIYNVEDFAGLQGISQNLLQVICTTGEEASQHITQISPVCRKATMADIVFLVDSSTSIGEENFQKVKSFLYTMISSLDIGPNQVRIGLAQYSDSTYREFLLNQYSSKSDILEQIQNLPFRKGGTNTGAALDFIGEEYFTESAGSRARENFPQVAILLTDGESSDEVKVPARKLRARGISVYVVGIGVQNTTELQEIASRPLNKFLFSTDRFDILEELSAGLLRTMCFAVESQITAFTKHYADVVFLIDSSDTMGAPNFEAVKKFTAQIVEQLDVGAGRYQIGFAQYSGEGKREFLLNTYESKEDVLNHIQNSVEFIGGPSQTGAALQFLQDVYFTEEAGSRFNQGTPQFTVVVTSAKSEDDVKESAKRLKEMGVKVVTVGILDSDRVEMEEIATETLVFQADDVQSLDQVQQAVVDILGVSVHQHYDDALDIDVPAVCYSASVADIAFLVDESSRIGPRNFQLIRAFLLKIIRALDIAPDNVRVALVLYSDEPRLEFGLNAFRDKSEMVNYVKTLPYRGGESYTGAAINFLRKNVFTKRAGSRKDEGVQQLAVVITDGQSVDNFTGPASKLRRSGITVYAVGIQNGTESGHLHKIASHPPRKHVSNVESLLQLSNIEWRIKKRICTDIVSRAFSIPVRSRTLKEGCDQTEEGDIYFLIDGSGSISWENFQDMKTFMNEMIGMFQVGAAKVRFGVVQYGSTPQIEFEITQYDSEAQLKEAIKVIQQIGGGTNTGDALRGMQHLFKISARNNIPQFLIVITDGKSQDQVTKAAEELRQQGIVIYAIGVRDAVQEELEDIAGTKDRMFFVNDFDSLKLIKHDIAQDICSPEVCRQLLADIILLIDSSESMNDDQFAKTKKFIHLIVNGSDVGADKVQIGVLQFSSNLKEEFLLNQYDNKADLRSAITNMKQIKEGTNTGNALKLTLEYFDAPKGGRPGIKQHLIVVTDGKSNDEVGIPARALRDKGVTIYAIGVVKANDTQLLEIAGAQERVFSEDSFESLQFLDKTILLEICSAKQECKRTEVADIIFVVHGSRSITELQFQAVLQLMEAIVNDTVMGKDNVQFGAIVYGTVPEEQFPLAQYSTKNQVREAISKLRPLGQSAFTARALNFARQRFDAAYGGRASSLGVTRIIVLITDEPTAPTDGRHLLSAVQALRQEGIRVIAIGIDGASRTELEEIVGDKGRWFYTSSYSALGRLHENITSEICDGSKPACGTEEADLVFLIDGSASISPRNFSTMKTFMKEIVDSFIITQDKVRIGVAQYSKNPRKEFYLNEFDTDVAIKGKIDNITQLKASTYTGKGLRFVKSFFEPINGGRKNKDVLQSLIVITDGKSNDSVDEAAAALRNDGIHIFAIGIGTTNSFELVRIAGDARRVFVVQNFEVLQTIERKIVKEVCKPGDLPRRDCNMDISVGVDFSERVRPASGLPLKQRMQVYLPRLFQQMGSVINISCVAESPVNIRFRYQVFSESGQALFDSNFEAYNDEIVQKFLAVQTTVDTYLNAGFLQSLWDRSLSLASARVKVLLVFSDGPDDSIEVLKTTADGLRRKGLNALLTIGLGNFQEFHELQEIEFGRGFEYMEPLLIGNPELPSRLWRALDTVTERECCNVCCKCFGEDGIRGAPGTSGIKGSEGYRGHPGHPGEEGGPGDRGLMGIAGKRGERGCAGARGLKGPRGYRGNKGENGDSGLDGIDGQEGERGIPGSHGPKGSSGRRGRKGPRGEPGERGELGARGDNGVPGIDNNAFGPAGAKGITGRQGDLGTDGVQGEPGEKGANGPNGRRGRPGLEGLKGNEGDPGLPGEMGLQGNQGTPGLRGIPGPRGLQGFPGPQGSQGIDGAPGSIGKEGPRGQKGEHGDLGEKGLQGLPGPRGLTGLDGDNGYGIQGRKGAKGQTGFPGNPGLQGEDGDPGIPGDKGAKGIRGQRGHGGTPGAVGDPGRWGEPGRMGHKGQKGERAMTPCELVNFTRGNCPCCIGMNKCPVYPTEVAFALDMSGDVTPESFDRMKDIMTSMLKGIEISRSNCPTGARVSVLSYNTNTKYLIRFSDFQKPELLIEAVQRIPLEKSSGRRNIGRAMRFVARNAFKRHRQGALMRNVAVFLTAGPSQDATSINTAVLEFSALDITPVVIALREVPNVRQAFSADDTQRFQLFVWETKEDENLNTVSRCALCFDKCNPAPECRVMDSPPVLINMDITYILDSSRNVGSEDFETMKTFVSNMLDSFVVASLPMESDGGARVALVQQAPQNFTVDGFSSPVKGEFDLVSYDNKNLMKMHIEESVHQLEGPSAVGHALDWTISNVFLEAPNPRKHRVIFTILGSQTSSWDREKLRKMSLEAKCQGFTMLTLALGSRVDDMEMTELSSAPVEQHLLALGRTGKLELPYALEFSRAFLNLLKREMNPYPPPGLQEECETLDRGDTYQQLIRRTDSIVFPETVYNDSLRPSASAGGNMQEEIMAATQEPIKYREEEKQYDDFTDIGVQDACIVDMDNGECDNYVLKWYFERKLHICTQFWYGGCGGNANRFETREECEALCIKSS